MPSGWQVVLLMAAMAAAKSGENLRPAGKRPVANEAGHERANEQGPNLARRPAPDRPRTDLARARLPASAGRDPLPRVAASDSDPTKLARYGLLARSCCRKPRRLSSSVPCLFYCRWPSEDTRNRHTVIHTQASARVRDSTRTAIASLLLEAFACSPGAC